jgi:MazG family protein
MTPVPDTAGQRFERLLEIMRRLRAPDGCPWDREQTHTSLRRYVLEETYEVLEAIDSGSSSQLCEELGDFLFEAVFLAQLSTEAGEFDIGDAIDAVCDKLVRRHPHVFERARGDAQLTSRQVVEKWETLKARERAAAGKPPPPAATTLSGITNALPALLRAYTLGDRAASVGFDWARGADVIDKIEEEVAEVRHAVEAGASDGQARTEEEVGDLLFAVANLARKLGVEPEGALRRANLKFTRRFEALERAFEARGRLLASATPQEMEDEWGRIKSAERGPARSVSSRCSPG